MKIIVSPSKTMAIKSSSGVYALDDKSRAFRAQAQSITEYLINELSRFDVSFLARKMKLKGSLLEKTVNNISTFKTTTSGNALLSFTGTVFNELDRDHYDDIHFQYAHEHVRILSALYGSLCAMESVKAYRLDMNMNMFDKSLYTIWSDVVNNYYKDEIILNLASNEYAKMIKAKMIDVDFLMDGKRVAYHSKVARGQMLDFIIKNTITNIDSLKDHSFNGYHYNNELSQEGKLVYTK